MHENNLIALIEAEHASIASIAAGATLADALAPLVSGAEAQFGAGVSAVLLTLDADDRFNATIGPSLPPSYRDSLLAATSGPGTSPFGAAAFSGAPVFSGDIAQDQTWTDNRKAALVHGYRACWVAPVFAAKGHILGVLGLLFPAHRHPVQSETDLLNLAARACAHSIERYRVERGASEAHEHFRQAAERNKELGAALEHSETELHMLSKAMPNQAWAAHPDGALYWFNERVYEYTGVPAGQLDGGGWLLLLHPDDVGLVQRTWAQAVARGTPYECELRARGAADGNYRWFLSRAMPVRDQAGQLLRWVGTNTDVQEQKNIAQKLTFLNESLELEVANRTADRDRMWRLSTDLMLVADFSSLIIAINPAWNSLLARGETETLGMDFMHLVHPDDRAATLAEVAKLERGITVLHFENRYQHRDGSYRWISWTAVPGDGLLHAIGRDVSDSKAAREALEQSEQALLQAQKLESIGKLTGGVAHDFNNVLQIISGNLQLLQLAVPEHPALLKRIDTAGAAVERGAKLSAQLLAFARRQPLKPLVTDLGKLLRSMDELLRRAIGEAVAVEFVIADDLWHSQVDPNQLENVLLNLAINARDAMDGQGRLTLALSNTTLDDAYAWRHADVAAGPYVMIAISDTGHGMSEDTIDKIFEPFFTTKKEGEGTGLGLSMAYGFVKQSGGHIKVHSAVGEGTTFTIYLPRSLEPLGELPPARCGAVQGGSETVLVVEDDLQVQATVVDVLRDLGYTVLRANDAASALAVVQSGAAIDLLFTDVVMPGDLRSPELARRARLLLPDLAVLFTSGYAENAIVHGGRIDPGVELLSKPYRREDLARKIRQVLCQRAMPGNNGANAIGAQAPVVSLLPVVPALPVVAALSVQTAVSQPVRTSLPAGRNILLVEDNTDARDMTSELLIMLGHTVQAVGSAEAALPLLATPGLEILLTDITLPLMSGVELARRARAEQPHLTLVFSSGHDQRAMANADFGASFLLKPFSVAQLQEALQRPR